jgi:hypothetical protein
MRGLGGHRCVDRHGQRRPSLAVLLVGRPLLRLLPPICHRMVIRRIRGQRIRGEPRAVGRQQWLSRRARGLPCSRMHATQGRRALGHAQGQERLGTVRGEAALKTLGPQAPGASVTRLQHLGALPLVTGFDRGRLPRRAQGARTAPHCAPRAASANRMRPCRRAASRCADTTRALGHDTPKVGSNVHPSGRWSRPPPSRPSSTRLRTAGPQAVSPPTTRGPASSSATQRCVWLGGHCGRRPPPCPSTQRSRPRSSTACGQAESQAGLRPQRSPNTATGTWGRRRSSNTGGPHQPQLLAPRSVLKLAVQIFDGGATERYPDAHGCLLL